eukprot:2346577-Rhodomonas_salina.2
MAVDNYPDALLGLVGPHYCPTHICHALSGTESVFARAVRYKPRVRYTLSGTDDGNRLVPGELLYDTLFELAPNLKAVFNKPRQILRSAFHKP